MNTVQIDRLLESMRRGSLALADLAFEAERANDIKERLPKCPCSLCSSEGSGD